MLAVAASFQQQAAAVGAEVSVKLAIGHAVDEVAEVIQSSCCMGGATFGGQRQLLFVELQAVVSEVGFATTGQTLTIHIPLFIAALIIIVRGERH